MTSEESENERTPPPSTPRPPLAKRFSRRPFPLATMVVALGFLSLVAYGRARGGGSVVYELGRAVGSAPVVGLLTWGLWRLGSRAPAAAWGGLAISLLYVLSNATADLRIVSDHTEGVTTRLEEVQKTIHRFVAVGGVDLATLQDADELPVRQRLVRDVLDRLEPLEAELGSAAELRAKLRQTVRHADIADRRAEFWRHRPDTAEAHAAAGLLLAWSAACERLLELAERHRDAWHVDAEGDVQFTAAASEAVQDEMLAASDAVAAAHERLVSLGGVAPPGDER